MKLKSIYISSHEKSAGNLIISMGLMEYFKATFLRVAFFRPFIVNNSCDWDIDFFISKYKLDTTTQNSFGFSVEEVQRLIASNQISYLISSLLDKYKKLEEEYDFVIIQGLDQEAFSSSLDIDINLEIAKNFGSSYCNIIKAKHKENHFIIDQIKMESKKINESGVHHLATFINRIEPLILSDLQKEVEKLSLQIPIYFLKEIPELNLPTISDVKYHLGSEVVMGLKSDFKRVIQQTKIAAMQLEHFLDFIEDGDLVIVPSDRVDIIVGSFASILSNNYPNISGMILTGGLELPQTIQKLLKGFVDFPFPIMSTQDDTYKTALKVSNIEVQLTTDNERKIALAMGLFNSSVKLTSLQHLITLGSTSVITPIMFQYSLFQKARENKKTILIPESSDERVLRACEIILRRDVANLILLGNKDQILQKSGILGLDITQAQFLDPKEFENKKLFAQTFYDLRKHKGLSYDNAYETMSIDSYFATMMVYLGYADGMVSGAIHTTQETIKPSLQIIKTKPNSSIVSSLFFMCLETKVLVFTDCAVNLDPTAKELADIAIDSAQTAAEFGITPKIAMLSYSTGESGHGKDVEKVIEATNIVRSKRPDLIIDGPVQYDVAVDSDVAKIKSPNSCLNGDATILVFPDLNTGNNTYKAVQRSSHAVAIGPILQGLKKPINDLSRGCLVEDIVNTIAITAIQAQMTKG